MYQKEIIYMGLHKNGSRLGSAGFLKVEKRDRESSLYLKVKNIPHSVNGRFPVRYYNGVDWKEVDGITLQEGSGLWEEREPEPLRQVRLQIILSGGYLIEGVSKEAQEKSYEDGRAGSAVESGMPVMEERETEPDGENRIDGEMKADNEIVSKSGNRAAEMDAEARRTESEPVKSVERIPVQKQRIVTQETSAADHTMVSEELPLSRADNMQTDGVKEDKWEQILDTYDKIHPYGDERVYVKLEPKDFVILQAKYQHLVNNSFLLHGFYNYRYVILGKENDYYLGVPGVFYEREKMVALMFGFEAFECPGGKAMAGEFGYYLRRVEL